MKLGWTIAVGAGLVILPLLLVQAQTTDTATTSQETTTLPADEQASSTPETLFASSTEETASSTEEALEAASSTEPVVIEAQAYEKRTLILQPSVGIDSHLKPGVITATITLQNMTCRSCETSSPQVAVKAFYVPWFDNDGSAVASSTTIRLLEQSLSVDAIAPWQKSSIEWSGEVTTPGRYSFIVQVDPDNAVGARDTYRTEFFVD